jgi:hypothetical protein
MSAKKNLGIGGAMWVFAAINIVLLLLARFYIPETKGRTLEQIEQDLRGGKTSEPALQAATSSTTDETGQAGLVSEV